MILTSDSHSAPKNVITVRPICARTKNGRVIQFFLKLDNFGRTKKTSDFMILTSDSNSALKNVIIVRPICDRTKNGRVIQLFLKLNYFGRTKKQLSFMILTSDSDSAPKNFTSVRIAEAIKFILVFEILRITAIKI